MAAELWEALRSRGITPNAPTFVQCRVLSVQEVPLRSDVLIGAGEPVLQKASMQLALEAARPENLVRTLAALDQAICRIAEVEVYFSAIFGHQLRVMGNTVGFERSWTVQAEGPLPRAGPQVLLPTAGAEEFSPDRPAHMADVVLICCWWMFREIESSGVQVCHVSMNEGALAIMLPVQKTDTRGMLCCRTLKCACRVSKQALCPYRAMKRHLQRLAARGHDAVASRAPLFPDTEGGVLSKDRFVKCVRQVLQACDVELTHEFEGQLLQRFTGHIARVSGAQWLHNLGVPLQMLQILGRWSSMTILKYLQTAPLQVLPDVAANTLLQGTTGAEAVPERRAFCGGGHAMKAVWGGDRKMFRCAMAVSEFYDLDAFDGDFGKIGSSDMFAFCMGEGFSQDFLPLIRLRAVFQSDVVIDMSAAPSGDSMEALADQAGAGKVVRDYLSARGVTSVGTLSMLAKDDDAFEEATIRPLVSGFETPGGRLELAAEEQPIARAVLLYMFRLAQENRRSATVAATPAPYAVANGYGVWTEAVNRYNEVTVAGCKREFPVKRLLGAESVMARFHWEHTVSRCYAPLELGELISKRSFASTNEVNHLATRKRPAKIQFDGESLQTEEDSTWEPRSLWAVVDGLDAIRWCHILFQVGEEKQINTFFEEMICRARQRPNKIEIFREYYSAVSWSICMSLNTGRTYKEATDDILNDVIMWNEYMAREPKEDKKRKRPEVVETVTTSEWLLKAPYGGKKGKGKGCKCLRMKRGDILQDDPATVAGILGGLLQEKDSAMLVTAAPPCTDFSAVNGYAQGSGSLFVSFVKFLDELEWLMDRKFPLLVENVIIQNNTDTEWLSQQLKARPFVADAAAFGMISRQFDLQWTKFQGLTKLQLAAEKDDPVSFDMPGLSFHSSIFRHEHDSVGCRVNDSTLLGFTRTVIGFWAIHGISEWPGCGYPDCDNLERDLNEGFPLIGQLRRSPGWHARTDEWYAHPISEERDQGGVEGQDLLEMPQGPAYAAFAFSVVQEGSDGRKKTYVRVLLTWAFLGVVAQIWCQDMMAAYRQYPVLAAFREMCELLGVRVKPSKEQLPNVVQKVLGVWISVGADGIEVRPDEGRINKMCAALQSCLARDSMTPEEAARLAGKLTFLQTSLFGQVGRAALHPIYSRVHGGCDQALTLNQGLRGAIRCLLSIMQRAQPRTIPVRCTTTRTSVLYVDAFVRLGEQVWKAGHSQVRHWTRQPVEQLLNGWGFVVQTLQGTTAGHGQVPASVVRKYGSRKAYIFFLEVNAQILALLANRDAMDPFWVGFCDNSAGKATLSKGFSSDASINNLLCFFWSLCAELKWFAHFEWVASHLNLSDPISRGDTAVATELQASLLVQVPPGYWRMLERIADDMEYANGQALHDAQQLHFPFDHRA
ncbi:unnamed protein product [Symbiodinium sp. CCMP2456]|nr:unnamed protein product [Symbiodinium sp. CCMP2456]